MHGFWRELKRRNVHRVAIAYVAASWLLVQVLETVFPIYGIDETLIRWVILALLIGFVPALGLSWAFEWSGHAIHRQREVDRDPALQPSSGRLIDRVIIGVLSVAVLLFAADRFLLRSLPGESERSIAVLPFDDLTADRDQAYFADGLAEELLNQLAQNPGLRVAARTSSFTFRDQAMPIAEIARRLDVNYVLEGSVRRDGERIRVTAQLIAAADGYHVWSETYDEPFDGVFAIQDRISQQIATALEAQVLGNPAYARETDPEAYGWFLQAKHMARLGTSESMREAVALLRQVVERDPAYAPAWSSLATVQSNLALRDADDYDALYGEARRAALTAIRVAPEAAAGYVQLAWIAQQYDGDLAAAVEYSERALELEPTDETVLGNAAVLLLHVGKLEESIVVQAHSAERSPVDAVAFYNLGLAYTYADRLEDAERSLRTALRLSPEYEGVRYQLGEVLLLMGRAEEALESWQADPDAHNRAKGRALALFALGRRADSDAALAELIDGWGEEWPSSIVHVHAYRGEIDAAFEWLEKEYEKFGPAGWGEWKYQRLFDNLRGDPRWAAFLERVGVSDAQLSRYEFEVAIPSGR